MNGRASLGAGRDISALALPEAEPFNGQRQFFVKNFLPRDEKSLYTRVFRRKS